jgi:hypothetical protein
VSSYRLSRLVLNAIIRRFLLYLDAPERLQPILEKLLEILQGSVDRHGCR